MRSGEGRVQFGRVFSVFAASLLGAQAASGVPSNVAFSDDARCDAITDQVLTEELGQFPNFPLDERLALLSSSPPAPLPGCGGTIGEGVPVVIRNLSSVAYQDVFAVAGPTAVFGSLFTDADGTVLTDLGPADAFRIDAVGVNQPLLFESMTADGILEPGEVWTFAVHSQAYLAEVLVGDFAALFATSVGVGSADVDTFQGFPLPYMSILASPVPCAATGDTGLLSPSAEVADTGGDGDGFEHTPENAFADGGQPAARNLDGPGDRHQWFGYAASVPAECAVKGIEVLADWRLDGKAGEHGLLVELSSDGGVTWSEARVDALETTSFHTTILGGASDTWGRTWTAADVSDPGFRVRVSALGTINGRDYFLDWIPVRIHYGP